MNRSDNIASKCEFRLPISPFCIADAEKSEEAPREKIGSLEAPAFDPNRYHPMRYHLEHLDWSVWGTITWESGFRRLGTYEAEKSRRIDFKHLLLKTRADCGLRGRDILYYHATEYGKAGENHFHFLIWNKKSSRVSNLLLAQRMQYFWNRDFVPFDSTRKSGGAGIAVISSYDKDRKNPAAGYCFKREFDEYGREHERYDGMSENLLKYLRSKVNHQNIHQVFE